MDREKNLSNLQKVFVGIPCERRKWEQPYVFRANNNIKNLDVLKADLGKNELFNENGECVCLLDIIRALLIFFEKNEIINFNVFINDIDDGLLKVTIMIEKNDFDFEEMLSLISLIISKSESCSIQKNPEKKISQAFMSYGKKRCFATIDNAICAISDLNYQEKDDFEPPNISFIIFDNNIYSDFSSFSCSILISMAYFPFFSLNLSLGFDILLLKISPLTERRLFICNLLFDNYENIENYDYTLESYELNSIVNAKLYFFDSKKPEFCFLYFIQGIPQKSNDEYVLNLLSSISWSETLGSILPSIVNENQYYISSSFLKKKGKSFVLFLNCSNDKSQSLRVIVINKICEMFLEKHPDFKVKNYSRKRLDGIWSNITTITESICSILDDFDNYNNIWNGISIITNKNNKLILCS